MLSRGSRRPERGVVHRRGGERDEPLAVGGDFDLGPLHTGARVGWMPEGYADTISAVIVALGGWDDATAELIDDVLGPSLVIDVDLGAGLTNGRFYGAAGLMVVSLGAGATSGDRLTAASGIEVDPVGGRFGFDGELKARTTHISVKALVGTRVPLPASLVLRLEVGGLHTVAATSKLLQDGQELPLASDAFDDYLRDVYTTYVWSPTLGARIGWAF